MSCIRRNAFASYNVKSCHTNLVTMAELKKIKIYERGHKKKGPLNYKSIKLNDLRVLYIVHELGETSKDKKKHFKQQMELERN